MSVQGIPATEKVASTPAAKPVKGTPWWLALLWVPTLYLAMGIPFNVVMGGTASRMYKSLGYPDGRITIALGYIGLAWSLKPLWASFLDMYRTKKFFVLSMEVLLAGLFAAIAMSLPIPNFFQVSIALFAVAAFASSTQDICADGIYLTALERPVQASLAGTQGVFWVSGKLLATGVLISVVDGMRETHQWSQPYTWAIVMLACAISMVVLAVYHFFFLPSGSISRRPENLSEVVEEFGRTAVTFFHKREFWGMIAFVFLYRLGEGLVLMEGQLFLQSVVDQGGLGFTAGQVSRIDAIYGTVASLVAGILGGLFASYMTLPRALGILGLCLNVPHFTYVFLSQMAATHHGVDYTVVATAVSIEKFGYSFGFVGNMIYMMQQLAPGRSTMTHYAFATSLMNFMLVPTNMISGPLAEWLGFSTFFLVVMFASVPSVWAAFRAPFPLRDEEIKRQGDVSITVDDPTVLSPEQRQVQSRAGRASMFAMLSILIILALDSAFLGWLRSAEPHSVTRFVCLAILVGLATCKGFLTTLTMQAVKETKELAVRAGDTVYVRNARGAMWAAWIAVAVSVAVLALAAALTF